MEAKEMAISRAHIAAAKVLVTPSTPFPSTSLISLIPTQQISIISMRSPQLSTNLLLKYCSPQFSLSKLGMVTSQTFLKTMHRKVKTEQQFQLMVSRAPTHVESASSVIPGPLIVGEQNLADRTARSFRQSETVKVVLQILLALSPQSRSSGLTAVEPNRLKNAFILLKYVDLEKFLLQISRPISVEPQLLTLATNLVKDEVSLVLRMRSLVQVTVPPQIVDEQLYLYPRGTWKD